VIEIRNRVFDKALWQHMLQEAVDKFRYRQNGGLPLIGVAVFKPEADLPVLQFFDAVIGNRDSVYITRQVF